MAQGTNYPVNSTGGEATHKLTESEMPSHNHKVVFRNNSEWTVGDGSGIGNSQTDPYTARTTSTLVYNEPVSHWVVDSKGGSQPHNNLPPYLAVYMWIRTA